MGCTKSKQIGPIVKKEITEFYTYDSDEESHRYESSSESSLGSLDSSGCSLVSWYSSDN